ncbi:hypothetical protein IW262DRAFT_1450434 [Armillaria fumosa]|nr:hypothetical protein IW262DRAFT_1450434 [Armillaria fumosa]
MSLWDQALERLHEGLAKHYWKGKLHWKRQNSHIYPSRESRPEFIPVTAPYMCEAALYDKLGFWDFPARMNWRIHRYDLQCHSGRCPPGICVAQSEKLRYGLHKPAISKTDGNDVSVARKVAFLQAWLFFGALTENLTQGRCSYRGIRIQSVPQS